jgi:glycine/D-amino acid oxidase-like deaminating enzyme/nitrite reductase/ring-hydroxylating ferredoxin subunit
MEETRNARRSIWWASADMPTYEPLREVAEADVCVIGGGITGLTAALLLAREGKNVVLLERHRLGRGVSGSTTAHLTALADADYSVLYKKMGLDAVRGVWTSMMAAIDRIDALVRELNIACDFERVNAYYYAEPGGDTKVLRKSHDALHAAQAEVRLERSNALPFPTADTLVAPRQARFHPLPYLAALARAATDAGVRIHEHTAAVAVQDGEPCEVSTRVGKTVRARHLVLATHTPPGVQLVQTEMVIYRSYVIAARVRETVPEGLYFDTVEPYRYIRRHPIDGRELVLIGGADHRVGKGDPVAAERSLEQYARDRFDVEEIVARWSAQVYEPADGLPYIGWSPLAPHSYLCTGYAGDGMTFGTLAAMMATESIAGRDGRWSALYRPSRFRATTVPTVVQMGLETAKGVVADRLKREAKELAEVPAGEGRLMRIGGQQLAVYRDAEGDVHACSAICPHLKCVVHWNAFEESWDCPCHGSRFDAKGEAVEGPSMHDLTPVELE